MKNKNGGPFGSIGNIRRTDFIGQKSILDERRGFLSLILTQMGTKRHDYYY